MMLHKFRRATVNASREPLRGQVEVEDTWMGGTQAGLRGSRQLKGRKAAWFWWPLRSEGRHRGAFAWKSFRTSRRRPCWLFLKKHVWRGATIYTDGLKSYSDLEPAGYRHVPRIRSLRTALPKGTRSVVPLADRAIGNLQQWLIGTHHGVSKDQLQAYLDEFVFRHNRRKQPTAAFQTLLGLGTAQPPTPYPQIRGGR